MTPDLFEDAPRQVALGEGAVLLGGFARPSETALLRALDAVVAAAPFRRMLTPGGHRMSVAMTNCGAVGWVTDRTGYRYDPVDPHGGRRWPGMPGAFAELAAAAAARAGYPGFARMPASLTRMSRARGCRCTGTKTNATSTAPSSRCRSGCPPPSCSGA